MTKTTEVNEAGRWAKPSDFDESLVALVRRCIETGLVVKRTPDDHARNIVQALILGYRIEGAMINPWQLDVAEFHRKFGVPIYTGRPEIRRGALRRKLILEEANETADAIEAGDLPEAIDGLVDTIYVCLGAALEFGVDLAPFFAEVHRTNMAKEGGPTREDGKIMKPEGWKPPAIAQMITEGKGRL